MDFSDVTATLLPRYRQWCVTPASDKVVVLMLAEIQIRERSHHFSPEQTGYVLAELDAILASPAFSGSKRCHDFLDCIVRHALAGHYDELSERFLGVELFGRKLDFDTGADSIVRVRASDVRRRLGQYYSERSSPPVVVIGLSSGTYIPTFKWHVAEDKKVETVSPEPASSHPEAPSAPADPVLSTTRFAERGFLNRLLIVFALLGLSAAVAVGWNFLPVNRNTAIEQFWKPFLRNNAKVTFRFGDTHHYRLSADLMKELDANQPSIVIHPGDIIKTNSSTTNGDVRGVISLSGFLNSRGMRTQALWPGETPDVSVDGADVIYIGTYNNVWSMNLNRNLRFFFDSVGGGYEPTWFIRDRLHPDKKWIGEQATTQRYGRSYALITRIIDPDRKRVQIAIGGLDQWSTQAACEFLPDAAAMNQLAHIAPHGWQGRNLQILLEMDRSGSTVVDPKIIDIQAW